MIKAFLIFVVYVVTAFPIQKKDILWKEKFNYPDGDLPEMYWSEGCKAVIKDGRLFVDADTAGYRCSTVWFDKLFSGNISIEFKARIVSSSDSANNINFFFLYSDPAGKHLKESAPERATGSYGLYHKLNGYIFTNVTDGHEQKIRYRFRDNPGFNLVDEVFTANKRSGVKRKIKIVKINNRFQYWEDGKKVLDIIDNKYHSVYDQGFMGLRTWHTSLWIDNLIVRKLK